MVQGVFSSFYILAHHVSRGKWKQFEAVLLLSFEKKPLFAFSDNYSIHWGKHLAFGKANADRIRGGFPQ